MATLSIASINSLGNNSGVNKIHTINESTRSPKQSKHNGSNSDITQPLETACKESIKKDSPNISTQLQTNHESSQFLSSTRNIAPHCTATQPSSQKLYKPKYPDPTIPVVRHVFTDKDIGVNKNIEPNSISFAKVLKLLTDQHSINLLDRHTHALAKLAKYHRVGFFLKDLVSVFKILNICADRADQHPDCYTQPMLDLLSVLGQPFLKEKSSDEILYEPIAIQSISQLGYLLRINNDSVKSQLCRTLISIYNIGELTDCVAEKMQAITRNFARRVVELSDVAPVFVRSLPLVSTKLSVRVEILGVLQLLAAESDVCCAMMVDAGAAHSICSTMLDDDYERSGGQLLFRSVDVLWHLLERGYGDQLCAQMTDYACIQNLRDAFTRQLTNGFSHYDRQLRNDLLAITALVAKHCVETAPFIQVGFTKQLILLATFQEVKSHNALVKHLKLSTNYEDFELKKMLINTMVVLSRDRSSVPVNF